MSTTLKSALLGILPVSERAAPVSTGGPGTPLFQDNAKGPTVGNGIEGLKDVLRGQKAHTFKYNKSEDRLYAYFNNAGDASKAYQFFGLYKTLIGNLKMHQSSRTGFRVDKASTFVRATVIAPVAPKVETFEEFVQGVKNAFAAFNNGTVSLTYKVDKVAKRIYAYAASNRKNGALFETAKARVKTTHKFHVVNSGEYNVALRFDFDQKQEVGFNTLLKGLEETTLPTLPVKSTVYNSRVEAPAVVDPASKLEGLVPQETLEQVRRILAGERLPKPVPKPRFVTQGNTELKLFVNSAKQYDLAEAIAELNTKGKDAYVFTSGQIGFAMFGSTTIVNPTIVLMRDVKNPKGAFVVVRTAAGYHLHVQLKQV